jgi:hypothetical protein
MVPIFASKYLTSPKKHSQTTTLANLSQMSVIEVSSSIVASTVKHFIVVINTFV